MRARRRMTTEEERGKRIHDERVRRGWSQEFLAHRLGISSSHLSKIELGKAGRRMENTTAAAIAAAFDWTISMVFQGEDIPPSPDATAEDLAVARFRIALLEARGTPRAADLIAALDAAIRQARARSTRGRSV